MNDPTMASLEDKCSNRFQLVVAVALRSKQLKEGAQPLVDCGSQNPITIAMHEIAQGKIQIVQDEGGETRIQEAGGVAPEENADSTEGQDEGAG